MQFCFTKELPIPLDELWFDYASTDLKQGFRLDIHAIRQQTACEVQRICDELLLNVWMLLIMQLCVHSVFF
ncbi:competence protein A [Rodentibacter pneumotropicus]|uniref:Competence protein A n=1 Tax=Rodentibacter pneumotropicus TaxID=758 RepID=A0A3S4U691_9PAST|nr:competence protein A [Rodentibacter pneumotropicus]